MKTLNYRLLSGSVLKLLALITMLIDHTASVLLRGYRFAAEPLVQFAGHSMSLYDLCRTIGRIAFPLYCFLLIEGYLHTKNRRKYGINLLAFALISEIPWNLEHSGHLLYSSQNVFFTLFLGYLGICAYEYFKKDYGKQALCLIGLLIISVFLHADYGCTGYGMILVMYVLRENKALQAVAGSCILSSTWKAGLAFIPINLYNGKRGFIKGKAMKYAFYAFYPVHMMVLYLLRLYLLGY